MAPMKVVIAMMVVAAGLAGCGLVGSGGGGPVVVDGVTLLTHQGSEDGAYPAGLGSGTLTIRAGCVAMRREVGLPVFILWPPGYDLRTRGDGTEVLDADGNLVAAQGDPITLGGGFGDLPWADGLTGGSIPDSCRDDGVERYFIAAPRV